MDDDVDEQSRIDETIFYRAESCNLLSTKIVGDICHHLNAPVSATAP